MWFIYTMEYYSPIKNKDIMIFAGKLMELGNILNGVTKTHKDIVTDKWISVIKYRTIML